MKGILMKWLMRARGEKDGITSTGFSGERAYQLLNATVLVLFTGHLIMFLVSMITGQYRALWYFGVVSAGCAGVFILARLSYVSLSSVILLLILNIGILITSSALGKDSFVPILLVLSMVLGMGLFERSQVALRSFGALLPLVCLGLLEYTDYSLYPSYSLPSDTSAVQTGVLIVTMISIFFIIYFYSRGRNKIEIERSRLLDEARKLNLELQEKEKILRSNLQDTKKLWKEFEERNEKFQLISENARDLVCLHDPDGRFRYISPSVKSLLGYDTGELTGTLPTELMHPQDREKVKQESLIKALKGTRDNFTEYRVKTRQGIYKWFESLSQPIRDNSGKIVKVQSCSRDITERKRLELLLKETEKMAKVGGWEYDPEKNRLNWTSEIYRIFGLPKHVRLTPGKIYQRVVPAYRKETRKTFEKAAKGEDSINMEVQIKTDEGLKKWIKIFGKPYSGEGDTIKVTGAIQDIEERKQLEEKLWNLSLVAEESSSMIIILDKTLNIEWVNESFTRITGYAPEEVKGKKLWDILVGENTDKQVLEKIGKKLKQGESFFGGFLNYTKQGREFWNELNVNPVFDEKGNIIRYISIENDVTELRELQEEASEYESMLQSINANIKQGIYRSTQEKGLSFVNQAFLDMFGYSSMEEVIHTQSSLLYANRKRREELVNKINREGKIQNEEVEFVRKDGSHFWGILNSTSFRDKEDNLFYDGAITDITNLKRTQEALVKAKEKAEDASKAKARFLSTMSHEIRTPLNAIVGMVQLLLSEKPQKEQMEQLEVINFSAKNLVSLVNDILDFSKIEAGRIEFEKAPVDLRDLLKGIRETFQNKVREKKLDFTLEIDQQLPRLLLCDKVRLTQILTNLVSNATKFTDHGKVGIKIWMESETQDSVCTQFSVFDTGIGIAKDKLQNVFKSFTQADSTTTRNFGGTGLGLAITKQLVEMQQGGIGVESELGKGSRFYFTLPMKKIRNGLKAREQKRTPESMKPFPGCRILLVEDNVVNQKVAERFLKKWNCQVAIASNGLEALDQLKNERFDLVLMDLQMPRMDGFETTRILREWKDLKKKNIPVVALSASVLFDVRKKVADAGMDDYITKPFEPEELYKKLSRFLSP